jgi:CheY-like chemotaxis protein
MSNGQAAIVGKKSGKVSILVAEDQPEIRKLLKEILESDGYAVHVADSGTGAVRLGIEVQPDLVLADVRMPGGSGIEAGRALQEIDGTPFVIATAFGNEQDAATAAGASEFIKKPVTKGEEILKPIKRILSEGKPFRIHRFAEWFSTTEGKMLRCNDVAGQIEPMRDSFWRERWSEEVATGRPQQAATLKVDHNWNWKCSFMETEINCNVRSAAIVVGGDTMAWRHCVSLRNFLPDTAGFESRYERRSVLLEQERTGKLSVEELTELETLELEVGRVEDLITEVDYIFVRAQFLASGIDLETP